jgi:hypothetical protein
MDIDTLRPGVDFVKAIQDAVTSCDVLLAVIGRNWLNVSDDDGRRRLDNPHDFVRVEIATALKAGIYVIPVLVAGAKMPRPNDLPEDLVQLSRLHAQDVPDTTFFHPAVTKLINVIEESGEEQRLAREAAARHKAEEEQRLAREAAARHKAEEEQRLAREAAARHKAEEEQRLRRSPKEPLRYESG